MGTVQVKVQALKHTLAAEDDVLVTVKVNIITGNPLFLESSGIQGLKASMCTPTGTSPLV